MSPRSGGVLAPRLVAAHLLALVLVAIATALGFWQLAAWSAEREAQAVDLTQESPVPLGDVMGPDEGFPTIALGRPVTVAGTWVPDSSLVISGRGDDTASAGEGYWAVTPVAVPETGAELLVVRGWAAEAGDLPEPPDGDVELTARLQPSQSEPGVVDDDLTDRVLPQLRIADAVQFSQRTGADLYGGYAVAAEPADGLAAVDVPANAEVGPFTAVQNFLYAVEWWVFAAFAAFVWWRFTRDALDAERAAAAGPAEETGQPGEPAAAPVGSAK